MNTWEATLISRAHCDFDLLVTTLPYTITRSRTKLVEIYSCDLNTDLLTVLTNELAELQKATRDASESWRLVRVPLIASKYYTDHEQFKAMHDNFLLVASSSVPEAIENDYAELETTFITLKQELSAVETDVDARRSCFELIFTAVSPTD